MFSICLIVCNIKDTLVSDIECRSAVHVVYEVIYLYKKYHHMYEGFFAEKEV